jgi:hypothetical protein
MSRSTEPTRERKHFLLPNRLSQTASPPTFKASFRGSQQGATSYVPYRRSKPPSLPDAAHNTEHPPQKSSRETDELPEVPLQQPRRFFWLGYFLIAAVIMYSLYTVYTKWVDPFITGVSNQWHYGDARISHITILLEGKQRDVLGIGYQGSVEVIVLPTPTDQTSQAIAYVAPQPFHDHQSRMVLLHPEYVNPGDRYLDIVVEVEGTSGVSPVLYGKSDGTFQWSTPPNEKG